MSNLAVLSLKNRALIALITIVAAIFGGLALTNLKQELIPSIEFPALVGLIEHPAAGYYSEPLRVRLTLKEGRGDYPAGTHQVDCGVLGSRYEAQLREFAAIVRGAMDNPYPYAHELLLQQSLLAASGYAEEART